MEKKKYILLLFCLLGSLSAANLIAQNETKRANSYFDYTGLQINRNLSDNTLDLSFEATLARPVNSCENVVVEAFIVSKDNKHRLNIGSGISVWGASRKKAYHRKEALGNLNRENKKTFEISTFDAKDLEKKPITFGKRLPFQPWMSSARVEVVEEVNGCAESYTKSSFALINDLGISQFGPKDFSFSFYEPERKEIKYCKEEMECRLHFVSGKWDLQGNYKTNAQELRLLDKFIEGTLSLKGTTLQKVSVYGYASPEGGFDYNKTLSQRRTQAFLDYILRKYPAIKKAKEIHKEGVGEDWKGLKEYLMGHKDLFEHVDQILSIIDRYSLDKDREKAIRMIDEGKTYSLLLQNIYPLLRRTTIKIDYEVRAYKREELAEVYAKKPKLLSSNELYVLAKDQEQQGTNPLSIFKTAYELYPNDELAALNYANALLKYGKDPNKALEVLKGLPDDERVVLPKAISFYMLGNETVANEILLQAARSGHRGATKIVLGK